MKPLSIQLPWGELLPRYTCDGENVSPPTHLKRLDPAIRTITLMVFHPHEPGCSFSAWLIWNIPPLDHIPENIPRGASIASPFSANKGTNDYGVIGYSGPYPPGGDMHRVNYRIYGLDSELALKGGSGKNELISALKGHILQFGDTIAFYR